MPKRIRSRLHRVTHLKYEKTHPWLQRVLNRGVTISQNPGIEPNRHRNNLDGPSIKPIIFYMTWHQTCALIPRLRPRSGSLGSGSGITRDHRSILTFRREIHWVHRSDQSICRGIYWDDRSSSRHFLNVELLFPNKWRDFLFRFDTQVIFIWTIITRFCQGHEPCLFKISSDLLQLVVESMGL